MLNKEGKRIYQLSFYQIYSFFIFLTLVAFFAVLISIQVLDNNSSLIIQNELLSSQIEEVLVLKKELAQKTANLEVKLNTAEKELKTSSIDDISRLFVVVWLTSIVVVLCAQVICR